MLTAPAQVGDDEAHVRSLLGSLNAGNDKTFLWPASGPEFVICDEVTSALDTVVRNSII